MSVTDRRNEKKKRAVRRNTRQSEPADYGLVDANKLRSCVSLVTSQGGALRFGLTSDGGAYAIGIYGDGDAYTDYVKPSEDMNEYLDELYDAWNDEPRTRTPDQSTESGA